MQTDPGLSEIGLPDLEARFAAVASQSATVSETLRLQANDRPDVPFLHIGEGAWTFAEFDARVSVVATALARRGVEPGDRVAYFCDTRPEYAELLFAAWRIGAVAVPLNVYLKGRTLEHQLVDSGSTTLVVDHAGLEVVKALGASLSQVRRLILLDDPVAAADALGGVEVVEFSSLEVDRADVFAARPLTDPAMIMYTSGTTGLPKGCVLSQRYCHHVGRMMVAIFALRDDDVVYSVNPLYHFGGILPLMMALVQGIPFFGDPRFSASAFLSRAAEVGATTCMSSVGWLVPVLLAQPERPVDRAHRIRRIMVAPVSEADRAAFEERFGIRLLTECFGQTECTLVAVSAPEEPGRPGSAGRATPWVELAIVDAEDQRVPVGEVGEIVIRPKIPGVMYDGYWNRPDATVEASTGLWHHTGDLGTLDEDGFLRFVDRKSDSMRRRGENIASFELEQIILSHHAVQEVAIHAVPLKDLDDDAIKACVVPVAGATLTPEDLAAFFARELPYFAVPRFVEVFDELPRNASGRVMKHELRGRPSTEQVWDLEALGLTVDRASRRSLTVTVGADSPPTTPGSDPVAP
jgi:crotonobetaine/carnitine-CoA ligase